MKFFKASNQSSNGTGQKQLVEVEKNVQVKRGTTQYFSMPVGYDLYEIKTVTAYADTGEPLMVSIFADHEFQEEIYRSLEQAKITDIAALPVRDKSGAKSIYLGVSNTVANAFNATIKVKAVNL